MPLYRFRTVRRILLDRELDRFIARLNKRRPSTVLDVGAKEAPYADALRCDEHLTLDIDPSFEPDICCDLHHIEAEDSSFDAVIATEVLEHTYDPHTVTSEIRRVLKPGGVCLLSVPFIYQYHPDPQDYYRYAADGLEYLFDDFRTCEVHSHGNRLQAIWLLLTTSKKTLGLLSWMNPLIARLPQGETMCPIGYIVWAEA